MLCRLNIHTEYTESLRSCFTCVCPVSLSVPAATIVKGFDEDSVASLSTTQDETQVSENGITNNSSHPFQGGGYMLAASYWPKVNHCRCRTITQKHGKVIEELISLNLITVSSHILHKSGL